MAQKETSIKALMDLGLNNLEARVYLALLQEPGITGYRVSKAVGKAVSNVYQALESLTKKGAAILHCAQKERRYSAVPVREMISRFRSDLEARAEALERELRGMDTALADNAIYRIENEAQLFGRIQELLANARSTILITADTEFILRLRKPLEEAGRRSVSVLVLAFEELDIDHCENLKLTPGPKGPWLGHWIVLDVDGVEHIIAFFSQPDVLTHAIWCNDQCLSFWIHFGMLADFTLMHFFEKTLNSGEYGGLRKEIHDLYNRYNRISPRTD